MRVIRGADSVEMTYRDAGGQRPAWGLDRERFDAALAAHAVDSGARLMERTALDDVHWHGGQEGSGGRGDRRHTADRRRTPERALPLADRGRWCPLARRAAPERGARRRAGRGGLGLVAHYEGVPELTDHGEMHVARDYYIGLAPLAGNRLNVGMALPLDGDRRTAEERFAAAIDGPPGGRRAPGRCAPPDAHPRRIAHRPPRAPRRPVAGWMLIGDAAGFIDPFTGEGIYRALRSARAAAEALAAGLDDGAAGRYRAARRRRSPPRTR